MLSVSSIRPKTRNEIRMGVSTIVFLSCMSVSNSAHAGRTDCIANYVTDAPVVRSVEDERRLLMGLSADLLEILDSRITDGFSPKGWSSPFAQARYDDLLYTLDFLVRELGSDLTPVLKFAVVDQFASPVTHRSALGPLEPLILSKPDRFTPLFQRHVGAIKYWQRFGLCWMNSPYTVYGQLYAEAFGKMHSDPDVFVGDAFREERAGIPMRYLGGQVPIIRQSYLPDVREPRVRFAAPPCEAGQEPRNIEFKYDAGSWVRTEPYLPIGTWYMRGFEDPVSQGKFDFAANTPDEFSAIQKELVEKFETAQADIGLPVDFPSDVTLECGANE